MTIKTNIDGLQRVITQQLEEYSREVADELRAEAEKVAKDGVKDLRKGGPFKGGDKSGYNKGWTTRTEGGLTGFRVTVYNSKAHGLTHLLEYGHAMPQGGRSGEFPHIAPVEERINEEYARRAKKVIGK